MNSYLKTAVYAALGKASAEFSDWEIEFHIVEAQRKIAALLPPDMVPEIVRWGTPSMQVSALATYGLGTHPTAMAFQRLGMQVLSVVVDTVNIGLNHGIPERDFARKVTSDEYFKTIADTGNSTVDKIWCDLGSVILTNFRAGTGSNGMLVFRYKSEPTSFNRQTVYGAYNAKMINANMSWDSVGGNRSLLRLVSGTWAALSGGIIPSDFEGGTVIQDASVAPYYNASIPVARIIRIWDDAGVGWLEARGPGRLTASEYVFAEWASTSAVLISAPSAAYEDMIENQYLSDKWNIPVISSALSNLWMKVGDKERFALYAKSYTEEMQQLGISVRGSA